MNATSASSTWRSPPDLRPHRKPGEAEEARQPDRPQRLVHPVQLVQAHEPSTRMPTAKIQPPATMMKIA